MHKSLFIKYLVIISSIILISFTIFGVLLMVLFGDFWTDQKISMLKKNAHTISSIGTALSGTPDYLRSLEPTVNAVSDSIGGIIFISDKEGHLDIYSQNSSGDVRLHIDKAISSSVLSEAINHEFSEVGTLDSLYSERYYTVGVPLLDESGESIGAVFVSAPATEFSFFIFQVLRMILISLLIVIFAVFVAVYIVTGRMVRPLRQMAYASKCMSKGDFSKRIIVDRTDEIGELAVAFNNMTVSLESLERMRRSFVGNVSHELKTPMTTIGGFIDGILDGTIPTDKEGDYLKIVSDEIKRLSRMVTSMLSLSKLESGEMSVNVTTFDLSATITRVALSFLQRVDAKNIEIIGLDSLEPVMIRADADLIYQVVYNLLDNAIKFTPENGNIRVITEKERYNVSVYIRNSGEGISPRELPLVFERFYKADKSRSADKTGTGLGLYITKTIVGIHEGTINVSSVQGEYTEFCFTLPMIIPVDAEQNEQKRRHKSENQ